VQVPETRYAKTADGVHIAYQVVGDGPIDLVWVMGWTSNVEALWEEPNLARFLMRLASFSRLILCDKRGVGLSDRVPPDRLPSLETRMDDVRAVMDAAGSDRAIVYGVSEVGRWRSCSRPRTGAYGGLILYGTVADYTARDPSNPFLEETDEYIAYVDQEWGTVEHAREEIRTWGAPSHADDERLVQWLASYLRRAASPGAAIALTRMNREINASPALPAIHVPTLVLAKTDDRDFPIRQVRGMTDRISGATLVEFSGDEHFFWVGEYDGMLDEIERFVAGLGVEEAQLQRSRATVLFTDIVGSTEERLSWATVGGKGRGGAPCTRPRTARAVPGRGGGYGGRRFLRRVRRPRARGAVRGVDRCRRSAARGRSARRRPHG
jgi:pimeloyl-ACP methyl ester carboxylesterase